MIHTYKEESLARSWRRRVVGVALLSLMTAMASAAEPASIERTATLEQLFSTREARSVARTVPADRPLRFRVRVPPGEPRGVLVYVSPTDSGELPFGWAEVIDRAGLLYIAAEEFGNERPTAERVLVALAAERLAQQMGVDSTRRYISGMSGGGRVASQVITRFPQAFSGALCIVGADYFMPRDDAQRALLMTRRLVLLTGSRDFNRREIQQVARRYQRAGVNHLLLMDLPDFAHQWPDAGQLRLALDFLDGN